MDYESKAYDREAALLVVAIVTYTAIKREDADLLNISILLCVIGIFKPNAFSILTKILKFFGPKVHALGSYILLNFLFFILVVPVGLIKRIFGGSHLDKKARTYTKLDFERPY